MKSGLLIFAAILVTLGLVLMYQSGKPLHVVLVGNESGATANRDRYMLSLIEARLQERGSQSGFTVSTHRLNASLPPAEMEEAMADLAASGHIDLMMGCGDSFCLRQVLPLAEKFDTTIIYPGASEGLFSSPSLVHLGPVANQFLFPALSWIRQHLGTEIMFLGGEDVRSRMLGRMLRQQLLPVSGVSMLSEEYLGSLEQLPSVISKIDDYRPQVLLLDACDWLNQQSVVDALSRAPVRIFSLCTDRVDSVGDNFYFVSHYYDHPHNQENLRLKNSLTTRPDALQAVAVASVDILMEVLDEKSISRQEISYALRGSNALTAAGSVALDVNSEGSWHTVFIGYRSSQQTKLLWMSDSLMRPEMFPGMEGPSDWLHHITIYWRNNRGRWRTGSVEGKSWL